MDFQNRVGLADLLSSISLAPGIAVKVRKSRRKPRPVKVIERVADAWGKEPWTETPQGKVEQQGKSEDKPAKTRRDGR